MKLSEIKAIIAEFEKSTLTILELELNDVKIKLSKNKEATIENITGVQTAEVDGNANQIVNNNGTNSNNQLPQEGDLSKSIKSPLVGTFYDSASPTDKPFVKLGDKVTKGQTVCIIEAMKVMNEISANADGEIKAINFTNGQVVGFDDILFTVV